MPESLACAVRSADSVQVCAAAPTCGGRLLSGLRRTVVSKEGISRFLGGSTVVRASNEDRKTVSQRSGARDLSSDGRADGHKQAGFTPAVKRNARRASHASCTVCLELTGQGVPRDSCKVRNNSPTKSGQAPRAPLFLPSGFAGSAGQGEREDYARSRGEGECAGKRSASQRSGARGRRQKPGRRA